MATPALTTTLGLAGHPTALGLAESGASPRPRPAPGTLPGRPRYYASLYEATQEDIMGRGLLLWLIGIPLPIILLVWLFGGLHG